MAFNKKMGDLAVGLKADVAQYEREMGKADKATKTFATRLKNNMSDVGKKLGVATAAVTAMGAAAGVAAKKLLDYADKIGKIRDQTGISAQKIQQLRYALGFVGGSADLADDAMKRLEKRWSFYASKGGGAAAKALQTLNVSLKTSSGAAKTANEVYDEVIDKMTRMEDQTQITGLAVDLFGDTAGLQMSKLIKLGSEAIDGYNQKLIEMGGILSDDVLNAAANTNDMLDQMGHVMKSKILAALAPLLPQMERFMIEMTKSGAVEDAAKSIMTLAKAIAMVAQTAAAAVSKVEELFADLFPNLETQAEKAKHKYEEALKAAKFATREGHTDMRQRVAVAKELKAEYERLSASAERLKKALAPTPAVAATPMVPAAPETAGPAPFVPTAGSGSRSSSKSKKAKPKFSRPGQDADAHVRAYREAAQAVDEMDAHVGQFLERQERMNDLNKEFARTATDAFRQYQQGSISAGDAAMQMINGVMDTLIQATLFGPMQQLLGGGAGPGQTGGGIAGMLAGMIPGFGGGGTGGGAGLLGGLFGGFFANGGRAPGNRVIMAGERGPELIATPSAGAHVTPTHQMKGGGNVSVNIVNQGTPQEAKSQNQTVDLAGTVVNVILDDVRQGGRFSRGMSTTFGLKRNV